MENNLQLFPIELRKFDIRGGLEGFFGTDINALGAINAFGKINMRLKFIFRGFIYLNGIRGAIPHAKLATNTFVGIKFQFSAKFFRHIQLFRRI